VLVRNSQIRLAISSPRAPSPEVITAASGTTLRRDSVNLPARFGAPVPQVRSAPTGRPTRETDGKHCARTSFAATIRPASLIQSTKRHWTTLAGLVDLPEGEVRGWDVSDLCAPPLGVLTLARAS
jgi:hypothetical protein